MTEEQFPDPYDRMSDDEFDRYIAGLMARPRMRSLNLKVPEELIERTKAVAAERHVPYQTLMKALIEAGLRKLERAS
jgi:predicted DNA binding CopG/RHH family protein